MTVSPPSPSRCSPTDSLQPEEDTDLYDEVDENQYKSIVKGRLQRDDFIEDDGVGGYADNGMDDWGADDVGAEEEEERVSKRMLSAIALWDPFYELTYSKKEIKEQ
jgi:DNA polymerase alpha subunit A